MTLLLKQTKNQPITNIMVTEVITLVTIMVIMDIMVTSITIMATIMVIIMAINTLITTTKGIMTWAPTIMAMLITEATTTPFITALVTQPPQLTFPTTLKATTTNTTTSPT